MDPLLPRARTGLTLGIVRRVVVTGPESTGKTTLAARLAAHLGTVWTPEYARGYAEARAAPLDATDIEPIARGQRALEEDAVLRANRVLIQDTDLLSTCVYAEHYYGACPPSVRRALSPPDLYLLLGIDVPWVPDPQRDRGRMREHMHALFRDAVRASGAPCVEITGDWEERFRRAAEAVEGLLDEYR
jgi:NadR type nicotinamide-nucleotide adenylyltransferase